MLDRSNAFAEGAEADGNKAKNDPVSQTLSARLLKRVAGLGWIFSATVIIPTVCAILYFGFFASDVFVSEAKFVVRSPEKTSTSGLGVLLKSAGFANAGDEIYAAQDFVESRDALRALNSNQVFVHAYTGSNISVFDRFNAFGSGGSFEDLYKYYENKITVRHDTTSSIITLTVRAYTPRDAQRFNEQLLEMAEGTVNRLNTRGRQDLIRFAQAEVDNAKGAARNAALALSSYRNQAGVIDPEKQAMVQLQMVTKLQDELISTRNQLVQVKAFAPKNPQVEVLEVKIKSLSQQIDTEFGKVVGDGKSLSTFAARYQRLFLESQFSDRQLASAMASLEEARNEARRKQAYVERIVQPNLPDSPLEPRRIRGMFATLALGIVAWGVLSMLLAGVKEHQA
jgi:capsular polysaccharide transport system permease protein